MDTREHAQQIFSMILAGWAASARPLPSAKDAESYAAMAMSYAEAFAKINGKVKVDI